ncbi:MAG: Ig-like domain-containing protein, partial [Thermoplasmata archaeon]|nr:Ig-like domain-containing protein [Thermoplasmata archaeon]
MKSWTITGGHGIKFVHYQIRDVAGLESMTYLDYIGLDTTQPTGSVIVNNGDSPVASTSVTLSLAYWDSFSGVAEIRMGNDGIWDTEVWQSPSTEKPWLLTSGDGIKTVYYQIKDNAGLISETYTDDIELDTTPPTIVGIIPSNGATGVDVSTNIEVSFSERMNQSATADSFSLVKVQTEVEGTIAWTTDGRTMFFIPTGYLEYNTTYQLIILTGARDIAGNTMVGVSDTSFTTEEVEEEPPGAKDYWWIILVLVIILLIIALILMGRRKKSQIEEEVPTDEENDLEASEASQSSNVNET